MKILQIVSGRALNGAARYGVTIAQHLAQRGHEVVLLKRPRADYSAALERGPKIEILESSLRRNRQEFRRIQAFCRERKIDVIHTHMSSAHAFGALMRLFYRMPCVATAHQLSIQLHWCINDRVICHTEEARRYEHRWNWVPARNLRIVPLFVDPHSLAIEPEPSPVTRKRLGVPEDSLLLTSIGDIIPRKGTIDIVEALPKIAQVHPNTRLLVSGWGASAAYRNEIVGRAQTLGVADRLIWHRLSHVDLVHALQATDVYVQASRVETGPIAVLEAMALGLPVVGTRCGGMPEFIEPGVTGMLVPTASPPAIGEAVMSLLGDPNRRHDMGRRSRERFSSLFSADVNVPKIEGILAEAAALRQPTG